MPWKIISRSEGFWHFKVPAFRGTEKDDLRNDSLKKIRS